jgi:arginyl-tRNA synthetase
MEWTLDRFRSEIHAALEATGLLPTELIELDEPKPNIPADLVLPCFRAAKALERNPAHLANEIANAVEIPPDALLGGVTASGPFLNFSLDKQRVVESVLGDIGTAQDHYGDDDLGQHQRVIVEYSSPNIARRMHIGHLRSTIIGQAINNILRALGYDTISDNHLGDWGTQFGGLIYAYKTWGFKPELEHDPIEAMIDLYSRFNAASANDPALRDEARLWFKRLEDGDEEARSLWRWMVELTMEEFQQTYARLNVRFDHAYGESFYEPMLDEVVAEAIEKGVARVEESGAVSVSFDDKLPSYLIRKTDGSTLYQTRDIAGGIFRWREWQPVRNIYVVGQEQTLHFQQVFETLRRMGYTEIGNNSLHVSHGHFVPPEGSRFSMRRGNVIFLDQVLDEAVARARQIVDEKNPDLPTDERAAIAEAVGVGAVSYNDLYQDPRRNITFDWDRMLSFTGNAAPYLQMMHARCCSILREAGLRSLPKDGEHSSLFDTLPVADLALLDAEQEVALVKQLARMPQALRRAGEQFAPSVVADWLYQSARAFARFYDDLSVLNAATPELRNARLYLVAASAQALRNGLSILSIKAPERM